MNQDRCTLFAGCVWALLLVGPPGCGHGGTTKKDMGQESQDMGQETNDMGTQQADLMAPGPDLMPATVTGLPTDCAAGAVTATQLYSQVVSGKCAITACHLDPMSNHFNINSAAAMTAVWVNKASDQAETGINRITPNDIDHSYVMYKLTGEQLKVADPQSAGGQMPLNGPPYLGHDELCLFINWIKGGAN